MSGSRIDMDIELQGRVMDRGSELDADSLDLTAPILNAMQFDMQSAF